MTARNASDQACCNWDLYCSCIADGGGIQSLACCDGKLENIVILGSNKISNEAHCMIRGKMEIIWFQQLSLKEIVQQLKKHSCICKPYSKLYCTISVHNCFKSVPLFANVWQVLRWKYRVITFALAMEATLVFISSFRPNIGYSQNTRDEQGWAKC